MLQAMQHLNFILKMNGKYPSEQVTDRCELCPLDLTGLETLRTYICMTRRSIDLNSDPSDIGLPHSVGSSMRMAHIVSVVSAFSAYCAFCHDLNLLISSNFSPLTADNIRIIAESDRSCKSFFEVRRFHEGFDSCFALKENLIFCGKAVDRHIML